MNPVEAKQILTLYRPGSRDAEDEQMAAAIDLAGKDPELGRWFAEHCAFQQAMRSKFRSIQPPPQLKTLLLVPPNVRRSQVWWRKPQLQLLAAAAVLVLFAGAVAVWLKPPPSNRLANLQDRLVATAIRDYRMDIETNDLQQVRGYLAQKGGPANFEVTPGLKKLQLTGGGLLKWRGAPVSMVCFDRGDKEMLYLFVIDRAAIKDAPAEKPQFGTSHDLLTASWTRGDKTYVLAGPHEKDFAEKYL